MLTSWYSYSKCIDEYKPVVYRKQVFNMRYVVNINITYIKVKLKNLTKVYVGTTSLIHGEWTASTTLSMTCPVLCVSLPKGQHYGDKLNCMAAE